MRHFVQCGRSTGHEFFDLKIAGLPDANVAVPRPVERSYKTPRVVLYHPHKELASLYPFMRNRQRNTQQTDIGGMLSCQAAWRTDF
ncbi:hypothetical protein J6590_012887 [Homalodisca vitripennis]|nr:hypothetical protein J6590_012887 [Homalodisca vitripennis]